MPKASVPVLCACLLTCRALAQPVSFHPYTQVQIGPNCCLVASGDFNGDGNVDLVIGFTNNALNLQLLLGDGKGGFNRAPDPSPLPRPILNIAAADLNRDGKLDIVIATANPHNRDDDQTYVLFGNGDGTFKSPKMVSPYGMYAVADFNGDGKPDLLSGPNFSSSGPECFFLVQIGNGDGTFQSPVGCNTVPEGDFWYNLAIADFNRDGKLDLIWTNARGTGLAYLWLGNGDGTFQPYKFVETGIGHDFKAVATADLSGDGKLDLVFSGTDIVTVLMGNGDGTFRPPRYYPLFETFVDWMRWPYSNDAFIGDFNGNNKLDIVVDNVVYLGNGDGTFQPPQYFIAGPPGAHAVVSADLNGDHKPDLVFVDSNPDGLDSATAISISLNNSPNVPADAVLGYSAASGYSLLAQSSIGSIYGTNLAPVTAAATSTNLPTSLGGIGLRVRDSANVVRLAPLYYVSPTQINFVVPGPAVGPATLTIDNGSGSVVEWTNATIITDVAAGFFTANGAGTGVPAATAIRVRPDGTQEDVPVYQCSSGSQCSPVPIDLSRGPVYLVIYGTGFPYTDPPSCQIEGNYLTVQYAGPQPIYPGLDQLNLLLPAALPSGLATLQCIFSGIAPSYSNPVQIAIK